MLEGLAAGVEIFVRAALGEYSETWWVGESQLVPILAGQTTDVTVALTSYAPPLIASLQPDPLVVDGVSTASVVVAGQRFRSGAGDSSVTLGDADLVSTEWRDQSLTVAIPPGTAGGALRVTACGAWSDPTPLRVIAPTVGSVGLVQPCTAGTVTALAPTSGGWWVGWHCDDSADGRLLELTDGGCTLHLGSQLTTDAAPRAIAVAPGGASAWIGADTGALSEIDLSTGAIRGAVSSAGPLRADGLAFGGPTLFALVDDGGLGVLHRLVGGQAPSLEPVVDLPSGRDSVAVAPGSGRVTFAMAEGDNGHLGWATPDGDVDDEFLPGCGAPTSVAVVDEAWAVVGCSAGGVAGLHLTTGAHAWIPLDGAPSAVALDPAGDIAFAVVGDTLSVVDLDEGLELKGWPIAGAAGARVSADGGSDHLLLAAPAAVTPTLLTPYDPATPCAGDSR